MKTMRSALVVGATGLVGSSLVKLLCESEEYAAVNVLSRRPLDFTHPKLVVKLCEFDQIADKDIEFAHEVFCCLGTTMKKAGSKQQFEKVDFEYPLTIAAIAKNRGVGHFIVISAMGANEKALAYYSQVKGKLEAELIKMDFPRLSIVRPSLITGDRQEFRLGETIGDKVLKVLNPILVGPLKKMHSIPATQIALAMKVIALHGKKQKVAIYLSDEMLEMQMPIIEEKEALEEEEVSFNWDKYKEEVLSPVGIEDEEVNRKNENPNNRE
ncbi:NAD(P)H-binding protein [Solibacillus sp. FSL W7-1472]|uniref:Predicted nucleoside-diphosphate-sugar epimerase n=1 Tax=Solibacillus silvestris (strain StLB046) TaxID=1002809 RepID=F2F8C0_SOLSS|nr:NAD(P)H-binding protein [Solibacillus silvestris]BAK17924.1 predicted nucleoside-diphosphate-sugar epimerase [Solibacillus silvestris StLB046]